MACPEWALLHLPVVTGGKLGPANRGPWTNSCAVAHCAVGNVIGRAWIWSGALAMYWGIILPHCAAYALHCGPQAVVLGVAWVIIGLYCAAQDCIVVHCAACSTVCWVKECCVMLCSVSSRPSETSFHTLGRVAQYLTGITLQPTYSGCTSSDYQMTTRLICTSHTDSQGSVQLKIQYVSIHGKTERVIKSCTK